MSGCAPIQGYQGPPLPESSVSRLEISGKYRTIPRDVVVSGYRLPNDTRRIDVLPGFQSVEIEVTVYGEDDDSVVLTDKYFFHCSGTFETEAGRRYRIDLRLDSAWFRKTMQMHIVDDRDFRELATFECANKGSGLDFRPEAFF